MSKFGFSSQSVEVLLVGVGRCVEKLSEADEDSEDFEVAESDACSPMDGSCGLEATSFGFGD
jgi:hypothetical protein